VRVGGPDWVMIFKWRGGKKDTTPESGGFWFAKVPQETVEGHGRDPRSKKVRRSTNGASARGGQRGGG